MRSQNVQTGAAAGASVTSGQPHIGSPVRPGQPLVSHLYTADPSAHVFEGRIYVYPSHDVESGVNPDDEGAHFDMVDYHVLSMDDLQSPVLEHGSALDVRDVPWADKQMWAPDAAQRKGVYYLFFPAKDRQGVFRIGVATSARPEGPFQPRPEPIPGSFSIDPCAFIDDDGQAYLYFGGIWGGQLQRWQTGKYDPNGQEPLPDAPAIGPRVAPLNEDLSAFLSPPREISISDPAGVPLRAGDTERRFFEASWLHKYQGTYYFSYSTGDTHFLAYATSSNPTGPFTYRGRILDPVLGWTTHHSIVEFRGRWYLFYHDSTLSGGKTHLRCVKVAPLQHLADGSIEKVVPA
jgi:catechol 2,3-dioxygenase-like lactoylglutathione lyase family enzyme